LIAAQKIGLGAEIGFCHERVLAEKKGK